VIVLNLRFSQEGLHVMVEGPAGVRDMAPFAGDLACQHGTQVLVIGNALDQGTPERRQPVSCRCGCIPDFVHRQMLYSLVVHQPGGRLQQSGAVAGGIGPLRSGLVRPLRGGPVRRSRREACSQLAVYPSTWPSESETALCKHTSWIANTSCSVRTTETGMPSTSNRRGTRSSPLQDASRRLLLGTDHLTEEGVEHGRCPYP
jgi:hypothetical protein